jgi:hypothetical protein
MAFRSAQVDQVFWRDEFGRDACERFEQAVPVGLSGFPAAAHTDHAARLVRGDTERGQNVRRPLFPRGAGGAGGDLEPALVELGDPAGVFDVRQKKRDGIPEPLGIRREDAGAGNGGGNGALKIVSPTEAFLFEENLGLLGLGECGDGGANGGNVFGAGAMAGLVSAAGLSGETFGLLGKNKKAGAFGPAEFMS